MTAIQMHRTHKIDGIEVSFRRSIVGWVACFGPDRCVHFRQPIEGGVWVAKRPMALESICVAPSLAEAVRLMQKRYDAIDREIQARVEKKLNNIVVPCRECGQKIRWTGLYGDWCSVCKPRD